MERFIIVIFTLLLCFIQCQGEGETILSSVLTPDSNLNRQSRSYYDRYAYGRPYDRLDDRPSRCGRCDDDDDDDDDYDRGRDRDDDRRSNRPTYGSRRDRNRNDDDGRYDNDRKNKNGTDDDNDDKKHSQDDDKDRDRHSSKRNKHRNRHDDRDRYRPDYYDRFLRDPYRDRYDDPYARRPYDRYPYDRYDDYGRYDQYSGYRRPYYDDRATAYEDSFGGYGPGVGRGPHDSFRPWDETYRGQAGWDAGGRGYYFASGRPDATSWQGQRDYSRPSISGGGWQSQGNGYSSGYRDPYQSGYGSGYQDSGYGYGQAQGYGQSSGWRNVGAIRPYRDQRQRICRKSNDVYPTNYNSLDSHYDGVANLDRKQQPQDNRYDQNQDRYAQNQGGYGQNKGGYGQSQAHGQIISYQPGTYAQSSTTQATSYLFQRSDELVTQPETTALPS